MLTHRGDEFLTVQAVQRLPLRQGTQVDGVDVGLGQRIADQDLLVGRVVRQRIGALQGNPLHTGREELRGAGGVLEELAVLRDLLHRHDPGHLINQLLLQIRQHQPLTEPGSGMQRRLDQNVAAPVRPQTLCPPRVRPGPREQVPQSCDPLLPRRAEFIGSVSGRRRTVRHPCTSHGMCLRHKHVAEHINGDTCCHQILSSRYPKPGKPS